MKKKIALILSFMIVLMCMLPAITSFAFDIRPSGGMSIQELKKEL